MLPKVSKQHDLGAKINKASHFKNKKLLIYS